MTPAIKAQVIRDTISCAWLYLICLGIAALYQFDHFGHIALHAQVNGVAIAVVVVAWVAMYKYRCQQDEQVQDARREWLDRLADQCPGEDLEPEVDLTFEITEPEDLEWLEEEEIC